MEKIVSFDKQGRIYIPEEIRKSFLNKTLVISFSNEILCLKPMEDDPIEALAKLGKTKLKVKSIHQLKKEARKTIEDDAEKKLRRY